MLLQHLLLVPALESVSERLDGSEPIRNEMQPLHESVGAEVVGPQFHFCGDGFFFLVTDSVMKVRVCEMKVSPTSSGSPQ